MAVTLAQFLEKIHPSWLALAQPFLAHLGPRVWLDDGVLQQEVLLDPFPEVQLNLFGHELEGMSCTCENQDPVCEHIVAVCLALRDSAEEAL